MNEPMRYVASRSKRTGSKEQVKRTQHPTGIAEREMKGIVQSGANKEAAAVHWQSPVKQPAGDPD